MTSPQPTPPMQLKRQVYLCCTVLLCLLLLFVLYIIIQTAYINYAVAHNSIGRPSRVLGFIRCIAAVCTVWGGITLGKYRWRMVYIEKRHWKHYFKKYLAGK